MMNLARPFAALALLAAASTPAVADETVTTTQADTLVVVTPNAPVIVNSAAPGAPAAATPIPTAPPIAIAPSAAPQNEAWDNVSHINGQIVEVGDRGKYLKKTFKTSIATNPIGWLVGSYGLSISHAVHPNVALRADANLFNDLWGEGTDGHEVGATAVVYFKRVFQGPFLEAGLIARHTETNYDYDYGYDYDYDDSATLVGPQVMFGWQWTFDSGLNAAMAFGLAKNAAARDEDEYGYSSDPDIEPAGYFRIGYAWE